MLFFILFFWILLYTNWLPRLEKDLHCSRTYIYLFLCLMIVSHWIPHIDLDSKWTIHVGLIMIIFICFYFFTHITQKIFFLSILLSSSSIAFSFHEVYHIHTDWTLFSFRLLMIFLFVFGAFIAFKELVERVTYLWSGCWITHGLILYAHQDMLNPAVVGGQEFMDFCWLAMIILVLLQYRMKPFLSRFRNG